MTQVYLDTQSFTLFPSSVENKKNLFSTKDHKSVKLNIKIILRYSLSKLSACFFSIFKGVNQSEKSLNHFLFDFSTCVFLKNIFLIRAYLRKQVYRAIFQKMGKKELKMLKRAKCSKIWPKLNKIWKYFGKTHVTACNYCTQ